MLKVKLLIGVVWAGFLTSGQSNHSPCFTRNYKMETQAQEATAACVSTPECGCDDCPGQVSVYQRHALKYQFEVPHISSMLYLVTPNGKAVAELYIGEQWGKPASPNQELQQGDPERDGRIALYVQGKLRSRWQLPAELSFPLNWSQGAYPKALRSLGRRLSLDDSCVYLRRSDALFRINFTTHAITKLPPNAVAPYFNLRVLKW